MDKKPYIKILETVDRYIDNDNLMYPYRNSDMDTLEELFSISQFSLDYLDLDDFISFNTNGLSYTPYNSLLDQFSNIIDYKRIKVVEVFYNLIYFSNIDRKFKIQLTRFLSRYKIVFSDDDMYMYASVLDDFEHMEGSYGRVLLIDDAFVKKQLKDEHWEDKDVSSRFKNEFKVQEKLGTLDAQVLKVYDYDSITHSYLMDRADMDLYDLLESNRLSMKQKTNLLSEIFTMMQLSHEHNIIHRDLHPGNIMIKENKPYVSDFGFAKDSNSLRSRMSTKSAKPTHLFVAPEGLKDFTTLNKVSDVYSLGRILDFVMGDGHIGEKHSFRLLVDKCTNPLPEKRLQTVAELNEAFNKLVSGVSSANAIEIIGLEIFNGVYNVSVEEYLLKLSEENLLASQIVSNRWRKLANIIVRCDDNNQMLLLSSINMNFVEATGYNGWKNYDLFAEITYEVIIKSSNKNVIVIAKDILEECAKYRYQADDLLKKIPFNKLNM